MRHTWISPFSKRTSPPRTGEKPLVLLFRIFCLLRTKDFILTHPRRVAAVLFVKKHLSKPKCRYGDVRKAFNMPRRPGEQFLKAKKKKADAEYNKTRPATHDFYDSTAWRKLRAMYRRAHPLCEQCLREGRTTPANIVDHIVEIEDGGARLDPDNLQALCYACHNRKTARERSGRAWGGGG